MKSKKISVRRQTYYELNSNLLRQKSLEYLESNRDDGNLRRRSARALLGETLNATHRELDAQSEETKSAMRKEYRIQNNDKHMLGEGN